MRAAAVAVLAGCMIVPWAQAAGGPDPSLEAYGRPQQMIDIGGRRLNLYCLGKGSPTVILEPGLGSWSFAWRKVHAELAKTTRVCAYDRAGYGFSDPGPMPRDTLHLAADLAALTKSGGLRKPYVLVGASLGGMIVRLYADTHLRDVDGIVLVDPQMEHQSERFAPVAPTYAPAVKGSIARIQGCIAATEAGTPAPGTKAAEDCVFDPSPQLPASVNAHFAEMSSHPAFHRTNLSELIESIGAGADQVAASKRSYRDLPLIVLTAGGPVPPDPKDPDFPARFKVFSAMHDEVARLSSRGVNRTIPGATHQMNLSAPQAVIDAVNEVVAEARVRRADARAR